VAVVVELEQQTLMALQVAVVVQVAWLTKHTPCLPVRQLLMR
jgi:hypothetical protein